MKYTSKSNRSNTYIIIKASHSLKKSINSFHFIQLYLSINFPFFLFSQASVRKGSDFYSLIKHSFRNIFIFCLYQQFENFSAYWIEELEIYIWVSQFIFILNEPEWQSGSTKYREKNLLFAIETLDYVNEKFCNKNVFTTTN